MAAYRKISRDSVYFPEAMYETAWTLLRAGQNEAAITALDLLLVYDPDSPIVPEIKQLRGTCVSVPARLITHHSTARVAGETRN